ncbi:MULTISPECIES: glutathione S-transferase family protein [Acinetobacter]|uniref:Glutathione S-transferase family protein n=1 Tax=Acinetobacter variabilis TaxID=70346 RepID=A0A7T7WGI0_9GAMM|nr:MULTISPECIES: glutathione S-transferase family protein [Acinetobacter]NHB64333.1 glutathione S-transferase family protein [Acinetobacter sp. GFQ9D191M]NHB99852.1 glutathione S-transferase family protein [Acinetobacter sp. GFQ9D192M]QQN87137.1 glutathione S-transferase family protein [Acinetobacter variabilis]UNW07763.1 glutathione S-transferase family protein [Acinetobacter variabilis]WPC33882.1 glutathione S-transferase family protein [Acinetobacter sp. YWS30-1]
MRILYQFPLSHFCEKARWMLDYKELEYVAQNLMPGAHRAFARLKTGQNRLPILRDQERWIADSTKIALYLDEQYPEHRLLPAEASLRQQALDIDEITQELGRHVRRWMLAQALSHDHESMDILIGEKGYLRQFEKFSKPLLKTILTKGYALTEETLEQSKQFIKDSVEQLNQIRMEKEGPYLVGSRFSLADIAVCSILAPLLAIPGTPWERESFESMSDEYREYQSHLAELPLGQYIQKMYRNERNARVDWRGV